MRMLMNNLDPGRRRAARGPRGVWWHRAGGTLVGGLRRHRPHPHHAGQRRDAAGPERQAGRRLPHPRGCAPRPDRQQQPGRALGQLGRLPRSGAEGTHHVPADDGRLVDLHRDPGHPPGHLRDFRRTGAPALRRVAAGAAGGHRRARRDGRRPAAGGHDERRRHPLHRGPIRRAFAAASRRATSIARRPRSTKRCAGATRRGGRGSRSASRWPATAPKCCPSWCAAVSFPMCSPTRPRPTIRLVGTSRPATTWMLRPSCARATRRTTCGARPSRWRPHVRAMLDLMRRGAVTFDYGNNLRTVAFDAGVKGRLRLSGLRPPRMSGRCSARGRGRSAGSR